MAIIRREDVRAKITIGTLVVETPKILSFNITRARKQPYATFSASLEINIDDANIATSGLVVIEAGLKGNLIRRFTGYVEQVSMEPHWEKANIFVVNISGSDKMKELDGKKFSRRQRCLGLGKLATITGIVTEAHNKGYIMVDPITDKGTEGGRYITSSLSMGDVPELIKTRDINTSNPYSLYAKKATAAETMALPDLVMDPAYLQIPQNGSQTATCSTCTSDSTLPNGGIKWGSSNANVTVTQDPNDPTKVSIRQAGTGSATVMVQDSQGRVGYINISGILVHDHAALGSGGPAFGVYKSG
jgi:hypothetical protein